MATTGHTLGTESTTCRGQALYQEEVALLHVLRSSGGPLTAHEASERTGMDAGFARLGLALLEDRGLI